MTEVANKYSVSQMAVRGVLMRRGVERRMARRRSGQRVFEKALLCFL
jgi:hypothetical protein